MPNNFRSNVTSAIGTSASNVYVCQAGSQTTAIGMTIANLINTPIAANVTFTAGGTTVFLVKQASIAPGGALVPIGGDQKLVLEPGDYLQVQSSVATSADVIVSVLEIT